MKRAIPFALAAAAAASLALLIMTGEPGATAPGDPDRASAGEGGADASLAEVEAEEAGERRRRGTPETAAEPDGALDADGDGDAKAAGDARLVVRFTGSAADADDAVPGEGFRLVAEGRSGGERFERSATVTAGGEVHFADLPSESGWRVLLTASRFVDQNIGAPAVPAGATHTVEVPLERGVEVAGRVEDSAGAPIADARVRLSTWRHFDAALMPGRNAVVRTDAEGRFDAAGVEGGDLSVRATAEGYLLGSVDLGERANGEVITGVVVTLDRGQAVTGTVLWPGGAPAASAQVRVARPGRRWSAARRSVADAEGRFEVSGLGDGAWQVTAWQERAESGELWRATADLAGPGDARIVLGRGAALTGRVLDDAGAPIGRASVSATAIGGAADAAPIRARSDPETGAFALSGLGPGEWEVTAGARDHGAAARAQRVRIPLDGDALTIVLPRHGAIAGVVVDPAGAPIPGAMIEGGGAEAETDGEGRFALEGVRAGAVELSVTAPSATFGPPREPVVALGAGERLEGVFVALTRGGRILGEVHPDAFTGAEVTVLLRPHDGYMTRSATVDAGGRFTYEGVAPGRYRLCFDWMNRGDWVSGYRVRREVFVDVREGGTERVVLGDPTDYPVLVTGVVREGGEPREGLLMYIYDPGESENQPLMVARTDAEGRYEAALPRSGPTLFTAGIGQQRQARFLREVTDEPRQRIDLDLPGGTLQGRVVRESGGPVPTRFVVLIHADAPVGTMQLGEAQFQLSRPDGSFRFEGLHPGRYRLRSGGYVSPGRVDGLVVLEDVVIPETGEAPPIEVVVPDAAALTVRARDADGAPLPGATVEVLVEAGWPALLRDDRTTAYDGSLRFTGLPPGSVTAIVRGRSGEEVGRAEGVLAADAQNALEVVCR